MVNCIIDGCNTRKFARRLCMNHYQNARNNGQLEEFPRERVITTGHIKYKESSEHRAWRDMKDRCYDVDDKDYPRYGGRGIKVYDEWLYSYERFIKDMGLKPSPDLSLDRIDVNKGYFPDNCRWADNFTQANNRRNSGKYPGVKHIHKPWHATLIVNGERVLNEHFLTRREAVDARKEAVNKYIYKH